MFVHSTHPFPFQLSKESRLAFANPNAPSAAPEGMEAAKNEKPEAVDTKKGTESTRKAIEGLNRMQDKPKRPVLQMDEIRVEGRVAKPKPKREVMRMDEIHVEGRVNKPKPVIRMPETLVTGRVPKETVKRSPSASAPTAPTTVDLGPKPEVRLPKLESAVTEAEQARERGETADERLASLLQTLQPKLNVARLGNMADQIARIGKRVPPNQFDAFSKELNRQLDSYRKDANSSRDQDLPLLSSKYETKISKILDQYNRG